MNIKYLDQIDRMKPLNLIDVNIDIEFYEDVLLNNKMIKDSWRIFIEDIFRLRYYANKYGVDECYKEYMKFTMVSDSNKTKKISTSWGFHNSDLESPTYIKHPRTVYLKLPYLYRDIKRDGNLQFPIFIKSVYNTKNKIKLVQVGSNGKIVTLSRYFPDKKVDLFISKRKNQKLISSKINTMDLFFDRWGKKINPENDIELIVILGKYFNTDTDTDSDYFVYEMNIHKNEKNFYDKILENEEIWKYIYNTIINFELNNINDYKKLLDAIVLDTQSML